MARRGKRPGIIRRSWRLLRWPALFLFGIVIAYESVIFARVVWLRWDNPTSTAFMKAERERLIEKGLPATIRQSWVPYGAIALPVKQAVIAAEDSGFTRHDGVEWEAIEKAAKENLKQGKIRRGGSTITMQLAKNLFLSSERSFLRKAQEFLITGMLELALDKRRILELYLNTAEWGVGVFGIEAAARHYFHCSAGDLDALQAAWLASALPSPKRADRNRHLEWINERSFIILERMSKVAVPR